MVKDVFIDDWWELWLESMPASSPLTATLGSLVRKQALAPYSLCDSAPNVEFLKCCFSLF